MEVRDEVKSEDIPSNEYRLANEGDLEFELEEIEEKTNEQTEGKMNHLRHFTPSKYNTRRTPKVMLPEIVETDDEDED